MLIIIIEEVERWELSFIKVDRIKRERILRLKAKINIRSKIHWEH